jgi:hypothetical protein
MGLEIDLIFTFNLKFSKMNTYDQKRILLSQEFKECFEKEIVALKNRIAQLEIAVKNYPENPEEMIKKEFKSILKGRGFAHRKIMDDIHFTQKELLIKIFEIDREELISIKYGLKN